MEAKANGSSPVDPATPRDRGPTLASTALRRDLSGSVLHRVIRDRLATLLARFEGEHGGRRMNELAAHLVERALPPVPVRQWVFSLPWHLRFAVANDPGLLRKVARAFIRAVSSSYRRRGRGPFRGRVTARSIRASSSGAM